MSEHSKTSASEEARKTGAPPERPGSHSERAGTQPDRPGSAKPQASGDQASRGPTSSGHVPAGERSTPAGQVTIFVNDKPFTAKEGVKAEMTYLEIAALAGVTARQEVTQVGLRDGKDRVIKDTDKVKTMDGMRFTAKSRAA